ncbi:MAG: hypothetical protein HW421_2355 [Ignavibacteria bacterium]|nr:hypothetical protein [Ignavibacteria bacterium]
MKKFILFSLFNLFIIVSCKENSPTNDTGTIKGKIIDAKTFIPISGALVSTDPPSSSVLSDSGGNFTLNDLSNHLYNISIEKEGYLSNQISVNVITGKVTNCIVPMSGKVDNNHPPNQITNLIPANNSTINTTTCNLSWSCTDPDNDKLTYDVYIGNDYNNLNKVYSGLGTSQYSLNDLTNVTYYWYIAAKDNYGAETKSETMMFEVNLNNPDEPFTYFPFDGTINDNSSNHWETSSYGTNFIQDRFGAPNKAINFNGNSNITIHDTKASDYQGYDITVSVWIKPKSSCMNAPETHIALVADNKAKLYFGITKKREMEVWTTSNRWVGCKEPIPNDTWTHVSFVLNQSKEFCSIYLNGELAVSGALPKIQTNQLVKIEIGSRTWINDHYCGGMDELRVYRKALTLDQIKALAK